MTIFLIYFLSMFSSSVNADQKLIYIANEDEYVIFSNLDSTVLYSVKLMGVDFDEDENNFFKNKILDKNLISLTLLNVDIDDDYLDILFDFTRFKNLKYLSINNIRIDLKTSFKFKLPSSLITLKVKSCQFNESSYNSLSNSDLINLKKFELFIYDNTQFELRNLKYLNNLKTLSIGIEYLGNNIFNHLPLNHLGNLESLKLSKYTLRFDVDDDYPAFAPELVDGDLSKSVNWESNYFKKLTYLEILGRSKNEETDRNMIKIMTSNKFIKRLDVFLPFEFTEFISIHSYLKTKLSSKKINIQFSRLKEINKLFKSSYAQKIEKLNISTVILDFYDIEEILRSGKLKNLKSIVFNANDITQEMYKKLIDQYPSVEFKISSSIKSEMDAYYWPVLN